jgi:hypothetical protein
VSQNSRHDGVCRLLSRATDRPRLRLPAGAYICCLSNPQNLDIGKLLGTDIANSPFNRILASGKVTDFVMLGNVNTPIHSRLW